MTVILLNCVTLGLYQPCADVPCSSPRCLVLEAADRAIYAYFAVEMLIKVLAMGFIGQRTYLADGWNRLDLFIVIAGCVIYSCSVCSKGARTCATNKTKQTETTGHDFLRVILFYCGSLRVCSKTTVQRSKTIYVVLLQFYCTCTKPCNLTASLPCVQVLCKFVHYCTNVQRSCTSLQVFACTAA